MARHVITITQVARRMGISTRTIRAYEDEGFIAMERVAGRCLLCREDVETILLVERLKTDLGINLAGAAVILEMRSRMQELQERLDEMEREFEERLRLALEDRE